MEWIIAGIVSGILIKWWYVKMPYIVAILMGAALGFFAVLSLLVMIIVRKIN
jgi:hypothetical protein